MTRKQRGVISNIDYYENRKFGVKIPISLNKESGEFSASYGETLFRQSTLDGIKREIAEHVRKTTGLPWVPVMEIKIRGKTWSLTDIVNSDMHNDETYQRKQERTEADLTIKTERYWLAKRADGVWMKCSIWDSRDYDAEGEECKHEFLGTSDRRLNAQEFYYGNRTDNFTLPFSTTDSRFQEDWAIHYIPYDQTIWDALNAISDKMAQLHHKLAQIVGTESGRKKLQQFAQRLLPS